MTLSFDKKKKKKKMDAGASLSSQDQSLGPVLNSRPEKAVSFFNLTRFKDFLRREVTTEQHLSH